MVVLKKDIIITRTCTTAGQPAALISSTLIAPAASRATARSLLT
jgi:hypothetical protein